MAQRVEQIVIGRSHKNWEACHRLCGLARRLGNCATYILRQRIFNKERDLPTRKQLDTQLRTAYERDYRAMPSAACAQRTGQVVAKEFKSYGKACAEFKKHPEKFKAKPNLPGYKKRYRTFYVARNGYKISQGFLSITGAEGFGFEPLQIMCCQEQPFNAKAEQAVVGDIRIVAMGNSFVLEITYEKKISASVTLDASQACLIDIGIENLVTLVSTKPNVYPVLVKGGILKSINQKYNKETAQLQSLEKFSHVKVKSFKRLRQVDDQLHKISRLLINYCFANDLGRIVIGKNPDFKQEINMGTQNNQNFAFLPHARLIDMIIYKAEEYGITVIVREESYTSKASALDFDVIPDYGDNKKHFFSGKRLGRGLYRASSGQLINADVNGAINIGRKELGDGWLHELLKANGGVMNPPIVFRKRSQKISCRALLELSLRTQETSRVNAR